MMDPSDLRKEIYINDKYIRVVRTNYNFDVDKSKEHTEPILVESLIKTDKFFDSDFYRNFGFKTEILPSNCKYFQNLGARGKKILVIEDEPKVRTISIGLDPTLAIEFLKKNGKYELYGLDKFKMTNPYRLTLSFPYIVYVIQLSYENEYNGMNAFFRLNPMTSLDDYVLSPCLPNINNSGNVCLGYNENSKSLSLCDVVNDILNNFWFNNFNNDYRHNIIEYESVPEVCDFFTWAYHTKQDPMFIYSVKWLANSKYRTIKDLIDTIISNTYKSSTSIINSISSLIDEKVVMEGTDPKKYLETRELSQSYSLEYRDETIGKDVTFILTVGDEIKYKDKKYYVDSIKYDYSDFSNAIAILENDEEKIQINLSEDSEDLPELFKHLKSENPTSLEIGNQTINTGDLVLFKDSGNVKVLEKIIKTRDNHHQIKIGKYFYLDSCFLNENLKVVNEVKYKGVQLLKDCIYYLSKGEDSTRIFTTFSKAKYDHYSTQNNDVILNFTDSYGNPLSINQTNEVYNMVKEEDLYVPDIFRINNRLFTNTSSNEKEKVYFLKGVGIGFNTNETIRYNCKDFLKYQQEKVKTFLTNICANQIEPSVTFESFDQNLTYKVGEEVIYIDWKKPAEMLKIKFIVGFEIDDKFFYLCLQQNPGGEIERVPFINLETGIGEFATIRKVCSQVNDLHVGMRVKAKKSVYDFPGKDVNEIKAFIIDDVVPLVLFSNYRTLLLSKVNTDNFKIFSSGSKEFNKYPLTEPNMAIKLQDGDLFVPLTLPRSEANHFCIVHEIIAPRVYITELLAGMEGRTYTTDYRKCYHDGFTKSENRYGLLLPRYKESDIKKLAFKHGYPTIFSNVIPSCEKYEINYGIRRDWIGGV